MRVLFTTFAAKTHMYAQVPLAWALQTAGHEVRVASQPDLLDEIARTGLTGVAVGDPLTLDEGIQHADENLNIAESGREADVGLDMNETRPERLTWDYVLNVFSTMTAFTFQNNCPESMMDDLVAFARSWQPDLVVWDTMTFAGPLAAKAAGAAHARLLFGVDLAGRMRGLFNRMQRQRRPELRDDPLAEWLGWTAERHGVSFDESMVTGHFSIDHTPPGMRTPLNLQSVPVRYVPYNGPSTIPDWLREPPSVPRVCLTLGLMRREVVGADRMSVVDVLEAVSSLDIEVVATLDAGQREALPALPDNVRVVDFVPLNALLPTCSAIVHHGGSGTLTTACLHGVPQLVVPHMIWDSVETADRLARQGAGLHYPGGDLTPGALKGALERLLYEPSFARDAAALRREMLAVPAPNDIVPVLERLTLEHSGAL